MAGVTKIMVFERYIPELKNYDSILFLHQPMTSGQPLKIVQRHMAHPVYKWVLNFSYEVKSLSVGFFECGDESSELHN